ncbi:MAG: hypothetical protein AAF502_15480 [Bacteroidota bacterium]
MKIQALNTIFSALFLIILTGLGGFGLFQLLSSDQDWLKDSGDKTPQLAFSDAFDKQFSENPGFIDPLVDLKSRLYNQSITPKVILGKAGWLFLGQEDQRINTIPQSLGLSQFSERELKHWQLLFDQRQAWCAHKGMDYHLVIAPNKASVYPELLPTRLKRTEASTLTDQLIQHLQAKELKVTNLLPYLAFSKGDKTFFHKHDTHWNDEGAWIAANAVLGALESDTIIANQTDHFMRTDTIRQSGDLARMMRQTSRQEPVTKIEFSGDQPFQFQEEKSKGFPDYLSTEITTSRQGYFPKAILFHDSFGEMLKPFLSPHFQEIIYFRLWKGFEPYWIRTQAPEIVINLIVERIFMSHLTQNDQLVLQWYWPTRYGALQALTNDNKITDKENIPEFVKNLRDHDEDILVIRLKVEAASKGKFVVDYGFQKLNYELNEGENELFVQVMAGQFLDFVFPEGVEVRINETEMRKF